MGARFETRTSPFKMDRGLSCNGFTLAEALGAAWHGVAGQEAGAAESWPQLSQDLSRP